jgi:hypothetical protein
MSGYHAIFRRVILENSVEKESFEKACLEWCRCTYDERYATYCVCTKNIQQVFTIFNVMNGVTLNPVGCDCIEHIGEENSSMKECLKTEVKKKNYFMKLEKEHKKMMEQLALGKQVCAICKNTTGYKNLHLCMKCNEKYKTQIYKRKQLINRITKYSDYKQKYPIILHYNPLMFFGIYKKVTVHNINFKNKVIKEFVLLSPFIGIVPIKELTVKLKEAYKKDKHLKETMKYEKYVVKFGTLKGQTFKDVVEKEKRYCRWLLDQKWFQENEYNKPFIDYCKYRL